MVKIQICPISTQKRWASSKTDIVCRVCKSFPKFQVRSYVSLLFVLLEQFPEVGIAID